MIYACDLAEIQLVVDQNINTSSLEDMRVSSSIRVDMQMNQPNELDFPIVNPFIPRPMTQSCALPPPTSLENIRLATASRHQFSRPLWYAHFPQKPEESVLAEQSGKIWHWNESDTQDPQLLLDITVSRLANEEGLLGIAFHPRYEQGEHWIFTYYSAKNCQNQQATRCSILSKWRVNGPLLQVEQQSEINLLEINQPYGNHNGGDLRFGPDGYLYISLGDGGSFGDPLNHAQRPETLLGSILRLDIDQNDLECQNNYSIPNDNPFVGNRCGSDMSALPEVWAYGIRNTWRMSFDTLTGELWGADVGQDQEEEVNILRRGKNYGWRQVEGSICYQADCDLNAYEPAIHTYGREVGESITGGFVYRGTKIPQLQGYYVFADFDSGRIMAFDIEQPQERIVLAQSAYRISSFGQTANGELRILTFDQPSILKLDVVEVNTMIPFPQLLSETGCYQDTTRDLLATSVVPYYINQPFWSDLADKYRAFAIPTSSQIQVSQAGQGFGFPVGTVLIKTFYMEDNQGNKKRFETRLMHQHTEDQWIGYTYRWYDNESDAYLLTDAENIQLSGLSGVQDWSFLSRSDCLKCHTQASGRALGLEMMQLNRWVTLDNGRYNQLTAWQEANYLVLDRPSDELPAFQRYDEDDVNVNVSQKARTYLHVNCSPCHRPNAVTTTELDLRFQTPFSQTKTCDIVPLQGTLNIDQAYIIKPGSPEKSILLERMVNQGEDRMPSIGSHLIDYSGVSLISLWISMLTNCQDE